MVSAALADLRSLRPALDPDKVSQVGGGGGRGWGGGVGGVGWWGALPGARCQRFQRCQVPPRTLCAHVRCYRHGAAHVVPAMWRRPCGAGCVAEVAPSCWCTPALGGAVRGRPHRGSSAGVLTAPPRHCPAAVLGNGPARAAVPRHLGAAAAPRRAGPGRLQRGAAGRPAAGRGGRGVGGAVAGCGLRHRTCWALRAACLGCARRQVQLTGCCGAPWPAQAPAAAQLAGLAPVPGAAAGAAGCSRGGRRGRQRRQWQWHEQRWRRRRRRRRPRAAAPTLAGGPATPSSSSGGAGPGCWHGGAGGAPGGARGAEGAGGKGRRRHRHCWPAGICRRARVGGWCALAWVRAACVACVCVCVCEGVGGRRCLLTLPAVHRAAGLLVPVMPL
jgi:hypothetical protein